MPHLNVVHLMGHMTDEPTLEYTPSGTPVCEFTLAHNRSYKSGNQRKEETAFIDITFYGKRGEVIKKYHSKGDPIYIGGRIKQDRWEDSNGNRRSKLKVVGEDFEFIKPKDSADKGGVSEDNPPKNEDVSKDEDVSDDEIPF